MRKEKPMPSSSAAKARSKVVYVPDAIIRIEGGYPTPEDVDIKPNGTVQFVNMDETNWRVRLFTREHDHHADVDLFLPARSSVTVIAPANGECRYEVLDASQIASSRKNGGGAISTGVTSVSNATAKKAGGGGGGTIRIGP
jgi:hypothetical protein